MDNDQLSAFGWNEFFEFHFKPYAARDYIPGRVVLENKEFYRVYTKHGEVLCGISGKLRYEAASKSNLPAVGDWVAIRPRPEGNRATIHAILPRKSKFTRKVAGAHTEEQIVATNIDTMFLVASLNQDFNPRRIERYLTVTWESGAIPVLVLSKSDLCDEVEELITETQVIARGVPIHAISVIDNAGLSELTRYFKHGETVALLGSSGVGKSTLINHLLGHERLRVQEVRVHDDRGRHTTTQRELILLPHGGLVLDTPGLRELQLWDSDSGLQRTFEEIDVVAARCYFNDCCHQDEPRCAVREALASGEIEVERYLSYEKLQKELNYLSRKQNIREEILERKKWKKLTRLATERAHSKRH